MTVRLLGDSIIFNDGSRQWGASPLGIGYSQTWNDYTGQRGQNAHYRNSSDRPIMISITAEPAWQSAYLEVSPDGGWWPVAGEFPEGGVNWVGHNIIIPPWHWYRFRPGNSANIIRWSEMR